ncbi:SRPBCC family protein [Mycobacterium colombiense]|uniref:SRPBCC family protein n=1 Tax=Mycobacterium colombiense TaxID=339268 RepID=UPI000949CBE3
MPASVSISVEQPSTATPSSVYDALMDLDRWPEFLPGVRAASWEVQGAPDTGVGGVRRMRLASQPVGVTRDHIVEGTRPHHHAYVAAFPWYVPLKHYRGDIRIEDKPDGSLIVWTVSCTSRIPGLRNLDQTLQRSYARLAAALAQEAERTAIR